MKQQTKPMHPILAKFHEAKEAGFEWADDAIAAFDEREAKKWEMTFPLNKTYSEAIFCGIDWVNHKGFKWVDIYRELTRQGL